MGIQILHEGSDIGLAIVKLVTEKLGGTATHVKLDNIDNQLFIKYCVSNYCENRLSSIVSRVAGGTIGIESREGQGTSFTIYLPKGMVKN